MTGQRVWTVEQAEAATALAQGQVQADQARARAELDVEQARAQARRDEQAADRAARAAAAQDRAARRQAEAEQRRVRRTLARERRRAAWTERRALLAVLPIMGTSAGVALPAQLEAFEALTGHPASALAIAAMIEGGTWAGAAMESIAVRRSQPTGAYVALTWGCASVACGMNVAHGLFPSDGTDGDVQLALAYGLASLLGPISWAVYSRLQRHIVAGRTGEQALLAAVRRARYPIESWRALSLRAAQGTDMSVEDAWTQVWAARQDRRTARRSLRQANRRSLRRAKTDETSLDVAPSPLADDAPSIDGASVEDQAAVIVDVDEDGASAPVPAPRPATALSAAADPASDEELAGQILAWLADAHGDALPSIGSLMDTYGISEQHATRIHRAATDRAKAGGRQRAAVGRAAGRSGTGTAARVARLRERHPDMPAAEIARRLQVTDRTVRRYLGTTTDQPTPSTGPTGPTGAVEGADDEEGAA